jgi:hypothetical protein
MSRAVIVRYRTRPDTADENERLVKAVFAELAEAQPAGVRYFTVRLDDTTFIHTAVFDSDANPLNDLPAFQAFVSGIADRCEEPPAPTAGRLVGSYP